MSAHLVSNKQRSTPQYGHPSSAVYTTGPNSADKWHSRKARLGEESHEGKKFTKRYFILGPRSHEPGIHEWHMYPRATQKHTYTFPVPGWQAQEYTLSSIYRRHTKKQDSKGGTHRYFEKLEPIFTRFQDLFEHILLHLPFNDLYLARLINHSWRNLIDRCPKLQQSLFLSPIKPYHAYAQQPDEASPCGARRSSFWTTSPDGKNKQDWITVYEHPLIFQFPVFFDPRRRHQFRNNRRAACFRRNFGHMLATQPPMSWMELREARQGRKVADYNPVHNGITLGQLMLFAMDEERAFDDEIYFTGFSEPRHLLCGHELDAVRGEVRVQERADAAADARRRKQEQAEKQGEIVHSLAAAAQQSTLEEYRRDAQIIPQKPTAQQLLRPLYASLRGDLEAHRRQWANELLQKWQTRQVPLALPLQSLMPDEDVPGRAAAQQATPVTRRSLVL